VSQVKSRETRRTEIVRAAWELVAERGVDAVRIQDIAASVGTSTGTIHYYFRDRADILAAALEFSAKRFTRRKARQVPDEVPYLERILILIDSQLVGESTRQEWAVWIEFWGEATRQERFAELNREVYTQWRNLVADQVRGGQQVGEFPADVVPEDFATDLIALMDGLGIQTMLQGPKMSPEYMRARLQAYARRELGVQP
jgi:AcrR family transcriptional regulator